MLKRLTDLLADGKESNPILGVLIILAIEILWSIVVIGGWLWLK
jgi:hypothetical protein